MKMISERRTEFGVAMFPAKEDLPLVALRVNRLPGRVAGTK